MNPRLIKSAIYLLFASTVTINAEVSAEDSKPFRPEMKDQLKPLSKTVGIKDIKPSKSDFAIIGRDERYKPGDMSRYPISTRGQLLMTSADGRNSMCSATLVSTNHLITAAHCVYDKNSRSFQDKLQFIPGRNGDYIPYGLYGVKTAYIPSNYPDAGFGKGNADIAILELSTDLGSQLGYMGYGVFTGPPDVIKQQISNQIKVIAEQSQNRTVFADRATAYLSGVHREYPEYALDYFGYSNDTNNEMWGDKCISWLLEAYSTEEFHQMQTYCDLQGGASGSSYVDPNNYIRGIVSWAKTADTSEITDSSGQGTGNFKGNMDEVANVGHAISNYTFNLIGQWIGGIYGEETLVKRFSNSLNVKRIVMENNCNQELYIALRYKNRNGEWVNDGYYPTPRYSTVVKAATSDYFYYYAISKSSSLRWDGEDSYQSFYDERIGLRKRTIESGFDTKITLTCN